MCRNDGQGKLAAKPQLTPPLPLTGREVAGSAFTGAWLKLGAWLRCGGGGGPRGAIIGGGMGGGSIPPPPGGGGMGGMGGIRSGAPP